MNISVIIPTYNRADMLRRALISVLAQEKCGTLEVFVVDDGSSDATCEMVTTDYPQVKLLTQAHKGAPAARNLGMSHATGDYIALLDDDDEMLPESLALRMRGLEQNPDIDMLCADYLNCSTRNPVGVSYFDEIDVLERVRTDPANAGVRSCVDFFDAHLKRPIALTSSLMLRRQSLAAADCFDESLLMGQDWEYALRFSIHHEIGVLTKPVVKRHCHGDNMARQKERCVVGQVRLDRKVLGWSDLTPVQREFLRDRFADDLYEAAYYFATEGKRSMTALKYWFLSLAFGVDRRKIKLLARCLLPHRFL